MAETSNKESMRREWYDCGSTEVTAVRWKPRNDHKRNKPAREKPEHKR